ncbi:MAG: glycyl-radical enzyme activating protein [Actinomycetia bacterium]|nr:glycyl-radical enzyme activating protein [Actinomycetes bacterium]
MEFTAPIFDIQRFSTHDGPGIRSLVFLKGCALHCPWCQNPESQDVRPLVGFYRDRCQESGACVEVCEDDAVRLDGFRIDHQRCSRCWLCVDACAHDALRLVGETLTPEELMARVMKDLPYYETSGGGVTFTGGEPTVHIEFLERVLLLCAEAKVHTNIETSGTFQWSRSRAALELLDLIYFDLKILDPDGHRRHLGAGFENIIENANKLVSLGLPVEFRMPVVSGYTDTDDNIGAVVGLLRRLDQRFIHLLEYHNMGEAKIDVIAGNQPKLGLGRYPSDRWGSVCGAFEDAGIEVLYDAR